MLTNAPSQDTFLSMTTTQPAHVVLVSQKSTLLAGSSGHGKIVYGNLYSPLGLAFRPPKERHVQSWVGTRAVKHYS